jgi:hypothetical protein
MKNINGVFAALARRISPQRGAAINIALGAPARRRGGRRNGAASGGASTLAAMAAAAAVSGIMANIAQQQTAYRSRRQPRCARIGAYRRSCASRCGISAPLLRHRGMLARRKTAYLRRDKTCGA